MQIARLIEHGALVRSGKWLTHNPAWQRKHAAPRTPREIDHVLRELRPRIEAKASLFSPNDFGDLVSVGLTAVWLKWSTGERDTSRLLMRAQWDMRSHLRSMRPGKRLNPTVVVSLDALEEVSTMAARDFRWRTTVLCKKNYSMSRDARIRSMQPLAHCRGDSASSSRIVSRAHVRKKHRARSASASRA